MIARREEERVWRGIHDHGAQKLADILDDHVVLVNITRAEEAEIVDGASLHHGSRLRA